MKITVYTITDCQFSKQEKDYLTANKLTYEEKNLETNKEFLTEMLAVSNNFAGTPVTKIEKDDGQIAVLKGFTKEEFDKALGLAPEEKQPAGEPANKQDDALNAVLQDLQAKSTDSPVPPPAEPSTTPPSPAPTPPPTPTEPPQETPFPSVPPAPTEQPPVTPPVAPPVVPDFNDKV